LQRILTNSPPFYTYEGLTNWLLASGVATCVVRGDESLPVYADETAQVYRYSRSPEAFPEQGEQGRTLDTGFWLRALRADADRALAKPSDQGPDAPKARSEQAQPRTPSSARAENPAASAVAPSDSCRDSPECLEWGFCTDNGHHCVAGSDADCAQSTVCKTSGLCTRRGDNCYGTPDCNRTQDCANFGMCKSDGRGACKPGSDADCQKSSNCNFNGRCRARNGECVAVSNADCERSVNCKDHGQCLMMNGACARGK